ncbi:MAG TPA: YezD family protein [Candidatus Tectomicrobia bacterium]|nr:YezD family protein [Candidatus Tectomicrobia bacterium]
MMNEPPAQEPRPEEVQILRLILRAMREIRYGSVQIVIQDAKVVQIDKVEKLRLV